MSSTSETGHAKNVANFATLHTFILGYGEAYNPSKESLKAAMIQGLVTSSQNSLELVNTAEAANKVASDVRRNAFDPLSALCSRISGAIEASDALPQTVEGVKAIIRKIRGVRTSSKLTDEEKSALIAAGKEVNEISAAQTSFDNRIDNLDKLIKLLVAAGFNPNEAELKTEALNTLLARLKALNADVVSSEANLKNARLQRNQLLYTDETGLVDVAAKAKSYIKSLFGASSVQYNQVSGLEFRAYN